MTAFLIMIWRLLLLFFSFMLGAIIYCAGYSIVTSGEEAPTLQWAIAGVLGLSACGGLFAYFEEKDKSDT